MYTHTVTNSTPIDQAYSVDKFHWPVTIRYMVYSKYTVTRAPRALGSTFIYIIHFSRGFELI